MVTGGPGRRAERGITMIEVLVTIIMLVVALLALGALQAKLQVSEMESYQRAQALILVKDMASRMVANRRNAGAYQASVVGDACPSPGSDRASTDLAEWCELLGGAGERAGNTAVGAMLGGRGCVVGAGTDQYRITVAWQGLFPLALPAASPTCGQGAFDGASSSACAGDRCRRIVSTLVRVGSGT